MYKQTFQVMYLSTDGWATLRDDVGKKVSLPSPAFGKDLVRALKRQEGIEDAMLVRVETSEVYHPVTRQMFEHTVYTGLQDA